MSRTNPQFNEGTLAEALALFGISYGHVAVLDGRRGKTRSLPPDVYGFWTNASFHNYADYALSELFHAAFAHLLRDGRARRCAIMCSEAFWFRCHRRIVAASLIAAGRRWFTS
ncbi:DUF488 domain-containing protein [Methylobacterium fujisawaense]|uniref:DUF488 domain-containing protein n=1 Tax=Methylobacterium fujisawaense TaxID=107400 RepID=UPI00313F2B26